MVEGLVIAPNPHLSRSLLADPGSFARLDPEELTRSGPVIVAAPHPDDESLGCGGLIALARKEGIEVRVVFVSDGSRSHPNSRQFPKPKLVATREREAREALLALGAEPAAADFLRLPDGAVPDEPDDAFNEAVSRVVRILEQVRPGLLVLPWRRDKHLDHIATWQIFAAAVRDAESSPPRILEYPIWVWETEDAGEAPTEGEVRGWRLPVGEVLARKREAVAAHASQISDLISDDPEGFRLSSDQLLRYLADEELYLESLPDERPRHSLDEAYFEELYHGDPDPWDFRTSRYEQDKYRASLDALPRGEFDRALELGCSIGEFTAMLAPRCGFLRAIDTSPTALAEARRRCDGLDSVEFLHAHLPDGFPEDRYDLITLCEVGYYLSAGEFEVLRDRLVAALEPGGCLLAVHWTPFVKDYPLSGDEVHRLLLDEPSWRVVETCREAGYRLELLEKRGAG